MDDSVTDSSLAENEPPEPGVGGSWKSAGERGDGGEIPLLDHRQQLTVAGNELTVYAEFPPLLEDLLRDLAGAKRRIWIEMYIFASDAAGQAIGTLLKEKARAGLDVRVLYDAIGCQYTSAAFFSELSRAGVKVHGFHGWLEALYRLRFFSIMNKRNHRKLVVVDDEVGYFGGMNIIDTSATPYPTTQRNLTELPISEGWRDVHIRLVGAKQAELAESFERSWMRAHREKVTRRPRAYRRARVPGLTARGPGSGSLGETIHFFDSGPGLKYSRAARVFSRLLRRSEVSVFIAMAYFVPIGRVLRNLLRARRRGVRTRIIVPARADVPLVHRASTYLYARLIKHGIRLYERQNRMMHSKLMVVDQTWTVVGSCNLDPRSLWINLEFLAVIRSRALAEIMMNIYRSEMQQSTRVTLKKNRLPWHQRLLNMLAWSLRWWL